MAIRFLLCRKRKGGTWAFLSISVECLCSKKRLRIALLPTGKKHLSTAMFHAHYILPYIVALPRVSAHRKARYKISTRETGGQKPGAREKKSGSHCTCYDALLYCMAWSSCGTTKGNSTAKIVPWFSPLLVAHMRPLCSSTNCLAMDNPKPVEDSPPVG